MPVEEPIPVTGSSGASTGGNTGTIVGLDQVLAALAGLGATLQTMMQQNAQQAAQSAAQQSAAQQAFVTQIADGFKSINSSLSETVTKVSGASDVDTGETFRSIVDVGDANSRMLNARDQTNAACMKMMWDAIENNNAVAKSMIAHINRAWSQDSDHHDLGRHVVRVPSGPGTMDAKANA